MTGKWRGWLAAAALSIAALALAPPAGATGGATGPDPSFGTRGVVMPALPAAAASSSFELMTPTAGGGLLVTYEMHPSAPRIYYATVIERREPDGAPDPSFGKEGAVTVEGRVGALAEDPSGGVVYGGAGLKRLFPDGAPDKAFDARAKFGPNGASSIVFDSQGRMFVGGVNPEGPRYHPHEGETEVIRYEADGRMDTAFGSHGVVYLPFGEGENTKLGVLSDGSLLVGPTLQRITADGEILPGPSESPPGEGRTKLALFPDGSFAVALSRSEEKGCTVTRYSAGGTVEGGFAQNGSFTDPELSECGLAVAPEGGLLVSGKIVTGKEEGTPRLLLLTAAGAPAAGFGSGGSLDVPVPPGASVAIEALVVRPDGRIVVAEGGDEGALVGLGPSGAPDFGFGAAGMVVKPAPLPAWTSPAGIAAEPDGELIVTGTTDSGSAERRPFWLRLTEGGAVEPTASGAPFASVPEVATQPRPAGSEYVYAFVEREVRREDATFLAKFNLDGTPVEGFGDGGVAAMPKGFDPASFVVDPDGGVTVVGTAEPAWHMAAYRLSAAGRPVRSFGHRGLATLGADESGADGVALAPGGGIVMSGAVGERLALAELGPDGRPRRGFGRRGIFTCDCGDDRPSGTDVVAGRGRLYVLDHWEGSSGAGEGTSLVKVGAGGKLDPAFAGRGYRRIGLGPPTALFVHGGRLMVAGQKGLRSGPAQLREFRLDGTAIGSHAAGGGLVAGEQWSRTALPVTQQPNGRIVFAGARASKPSAEGGLLGLVGLR